MKKIKTILTLVVLWAFVPTAFVACNDDDDTETGNTHIDDNEKPENTHVTVSDDGKTSNGSVFSAINDKNFYLDYIKYTVEEGHLIVSGHDEVGFNGTANIVSGITYKGNFYEVLEIAKDAFSGCSKLMKVIIGNKVKSINYGSFYNCTNLTEVTIGKSVTGFYLDAFYGCHSLISINVDKDNPFFDSRDNCNAIIETATNTLIWGFQSTIIPESVTSIGDYAFAGCSDLTSVDIPNSVTSIGDGAFSSCSNLTSVTIPSSVTSIGNEAFSVCSSLTSVTIPESVTNIGYSAFDNCRSLTSVNIPNSITSIGSRAFQDCTNLTSVSIPNSVTSIGGSAFRNCISLTSVTIPNSVTSIDGTAFSGCNSLTSINIDKNNPIYDSRDNCNAVIETASNTLVAGCQSTVIPNNVTNIGDWAFMDCSSLTSVTIPNSVTSIGGTAFWNCNSLASVYSWIENPFSISSIVFEDITSDATLYVPQGTKDAYKSAGWTSHFSSVVEFDATDL